MGFRGSRNAAKRGQNFKVQTISQPQCMTQKSVHADPLPAEECEHLILQHCSHFELRLFSSLNLSANTLLCDTFPTVFEGHKHRVTTPENPRKISRTPAEPSERPPQNPRRDPRRTLGETPQRGNFLGEPPSDGDPPELLALSQARVSW